MISFGLNENPFLFRYLVPALAETAPRLSAASVSRAVRDQNMISGYISSMLHVGGYNEAAKGLKVSALDDL